MYVKISVVTEELYALANSKVLNTRRSRKGRQCSQENTILRNAESIPISEQLEIIRRVERCIEICFLHDFCTIAIVDPVQGKVYYGIISLPSFHEERNIL